MLELLSLWGCQRFQVGFSVQIGGHHKTATRSDRKILWCWVRWLVSTKCELKIKVHIIVVSKKCNEHIAEHIWQTWARRREAPSPPGSVVCPPPWPGLPPSPSTYSSRLKATIGNTSELFTTTSLPSRTTQTLILDSSSNSTVTFIQPARAAR